MTEKQVGIEAPACYGFFESSFIAMRKCSKCAFHKGCQQIVNTRAEGLQPTMSRIDIISQNGNDGCHYDEVKNPKHYTSHPSGVEVIEITEHMNFCLGNVIKYVLRADHKGNRKVDLEKALWYLQRELHNVQ